MASQQILFTVMPRGIVSRGGDLPVSVYVSPRLTGSQRLGDFPDWRYWTELLQHNFTVTFRAAGREITRRLDPAPLRPRLWEALFDDETFVRPHKFDDYDYSSRAIHSYPMRYALSTLKAMYQRAGVELALPDRTPPIRGEQEQSRHRAIVREIVAGLAVNWDERRGEALRDHYRQLFGRRAGAFFPRQYSEGDLGPDGLLKTMPPPAADTFLRQRMMEQFAILHHVPAGEPIKKENIDFDTLIDFHQVLSSLNSYPALLRALGVVLDFDLPADFLQPTNGFVDTISVSGLPWQWRLQDTRVPPMMPPLETAYFLVTNAAERTQLFGTAPGVLGGLAPQIDAFGLLNLASYGIAQVDVDGALHKNMFLSESWQDGRPHQASPDHPEVFDPSSTLPSLRSGGLSLLCGRARAQAARPFQAVEGVQRRARRQWNGATVATRKTWFTAIASTSGIH